ncbi:hypothetical protein [Enemella sp. A6]|uniref:hypothetical protein n=1 Tax=Enemella sp. A6 TaxID=3440152 RepID=UPI003EBEF589
MFVHPVVHVVDVEAAVHEVRKVVRHPIHGVFLIDHDADDQRLIDTIAAVAGEFGDLFLGANFIRRPIEDALAVLTQHFGDEIPLAAIWADRVTALAPGSAAPKVALPESWRGLHFGGVAFKYQDPVPLADLPALGAAARDHVDVATTSGPGTGHAADLTRLKALHEGLAGHPLGLASGVTVDNIGSYAGLVDHVLVATGILGDDRLIDEAKLEALLAAIA